jgi:hypothetical protein
MLGPERFKKGGKKDTYESKKGQGMKTAAQIAMTRHPRRTVGIITHG